MNPLASGESAQRAYLQLEQTLQTNSAEESIPRLKDFIRQYPDFAQAHNDLAVMYYREGNKLLTLGHYEKAVKLNPTSTFRKNLASFYFVEMGWVDDAIFIYTDILRNSPNDTEVLTALGIISSNLGQRSEARIFFSKLLELEPWNHEARTFIAELDSPVLSPYSAVVPTPFTETSQISSPVVETVLGPEERTFFKHILELEPENPAARSLLTELDSPKTPSFGTVAEPSNTANSQISSPDLDAILADLRDTITKLDKKNHPDDIYSNALALMNKGDEQGAARELERLVQNQPAHALAHNDLGVLYQRRGVLAKSQYHHETAVKEDPSNISFKKNLAGLYFAELKRTDDAIFLLTDILKTNPDDVETLTGLARIALTIGQPDEASIFINKVTELEPWNEEARELSGQLKTNDSFFLTSR